jgi:hypothetical protein
LLNTFKIFLVFLGLLLLNGCTGHRGLTPVEYLKKSERLQEFKNKISIGGDVSSLLNLSYIENVRIAIEPDVQYNGLQKSKYKGSMLVVVLKNDNERIFITLGLDKKLDDSVQKYGYRSDYLTKVKSEIKCYFISDNAGCSIYKDNEQLKELFENKPVNKSLL